MSCFIFSSSLEGLHHWTTVSQFRGSFLLLFFLANEHGHGRALFSRALAELKYMGMIKNSRKKADHISKLLWKGL